MGTNPFARLLGWLRAGYPDGVPQSDYIALLGILHRDLTETEVTDLAVALRAERGDADIDRDAITARIRQMILERPSEQDVTRVASRLAAGGWPLAGADEAIGLADEEATDRSDNQVSEAG
ncbi:DUF3349 domain-containing protein [Arsenicicoccus sp. oral taxon 190]|uniref:DUF3349 domain-containing protein n=1 Tax=Arsenicicoccus sp. oral taxon 190 TaxID=1658671 RepID=UPI00067A4367|nr:DUF3349 domain-containing protein [Arsenicicoccus sp. oral taxon 190]AKT50380.1 hypothetical protein ADJ73_01885 [Arsenicicoccus sp. oral taxon 190]